MLTYGKKTKSLMRSVSLRMARKKQAEASEKGNRKGSDIVSMTTNVTSGGNALGHGLGPRSFTESALNDANAAANRRRDSIKRPTSMQVTALQSQQPLHKDSISVDNSQLTLPKLSVEEAESLNIHPPVSTHARHSSAPTIPRKSSKRNALTKINEAVKGRSSKYDQMDLREPIGPHDATTMLDDGPELSSTLKLAQAILAPTMTRQTSTEPNSQSTPEIPEKKRRLGKGVWAKMKKAFNGKQNERDAQTESVRKGGLSTGGATNIYVAPGNGQAISQGPPILEMEIETDYPSWADEPPEFWIKPPQATLTSQVRTLPDGDDPFVDPSGRKVLPVHPRGNAQRRPIEDQRRFSQRNMGLHRRTSAGAASGPGSASTGGAKHLSRAGSTLSRRERADGFFSSSPVAQSTPRLRLDPRFTEDGRRSWQSMPSQGIPVFDEHRGRILRDPRSLVAAPYDGLLPSSPAYLEKGRLDSYSPYRTDGLSGIDIARMRGQKGPPPSRNDLDAFNETWDGYRPPREIPDAFLRSSTMSQHSRHRRAVSEYDVENDHRRLAARSARPALATAPNGYPIRGRQQSLRDSIRRSSQCVPPSTRRPRSMVEHGMLENARQGSEDYESSLPRGGRGAGENWMEESSIDPLQGDDSLFNIALRRY